MKKKNGILSKSKNGDRTLDPWSRENIFDDQGSNLDPWFSNKSPNLDLCNLDFGLFSGIWTPTKSRK